MTGMGLPTAVAETRLRTATMPVLGASATRTEVHGQ